MASTCRSPILTALVGGALKAHDFTQLVAIAERERRLVWPF
jgi:hypothetical protein